MEPERIIFPTDYPIKVVARAAEDIRIRVDAVFARHFGPLPDGAVTARGSAQSNFIAFTYVMRVEHEDQLRALHGDLQGLEGVLMVL